MGIRGLDEQLHEQRESDTSDVGFLHSSSRRKFKRKKGCAGPALRMDRVCGLRYWDQQN